MTYKVKFERRHFELIAMTIKDAIGPGNVGHANVALAFAHALSFTNPNFDRAKFLAACGMDSAS